VYLVTDPQGGQRCAAIMVVAETDYEFGQDGELTQPGLAPSWFVMGESTSPSEAHFARLAGVAPIPVCSGRKDRHRLDRGGDRQLNCALHRIAVTQKRVHDPAKRYLAAKQAEGKTKREALRCLKRQLVRTVLRTLRASSPVEENLSPLIKNNNFREPFRWLP